MKKIIVLLMFLLFFCSMANSQDNILGKNFEKKEFVQINDTIFVAKFELTNSWYNKFLKDLKANNVNDLAIAMPDTAQWETLSPQHEPFSKFYHTNAAYQNFPVVNISYDAAELFCKWLTEKYNNWPNRAYAKVQFRLPTEAEWVFAARGDNKFSVYAWSGPYLLSGSSNRYCNYKYIGDERISYNYETNTYTVIPDPINSLAQSAATTVAVNSYLPNDFGIYQMCGNAGEMVAERGKYKGGHWNSTGYDVRIDVVGTYTKPSPFVGFRLLMEIKND